MFASNRVLRFVVIGVANAAITFLLLNLIYYHLHQSKIISELIATSCALIFSFVMNRTFVFGDRSRKAHQQAPMFVAVTVSGSLIVLNLVYLLSLKMLEGNEAFIINFIHSATNITLSPSFVDINLSTVIGAIFAMIWNYNGYRLFVFSNIPQPKNPSKP